MPVSRHKRRPNKHWPEDFAKYRAAKVLKIDLPDYDLMRKLLNDEVTPDERRAFDKKLGVYQPANTDTSEKPLLITSTGVILEPFQPKESEPGMSSLLTKEGMKDKTVGKTKTFR